MQTMHEIGTEFRYNHTDDEDDYEEGCIGFEQCIVLGYVYYDANLFYTCIGTKSGMQFDMDNTSVSTRIHGAGYED